MSRKHDAIFDDVLSDLDSAPDASDRAGARFLKRTTAISDRLAGEVEEKTLRWIDPARCRMWDRHNRDYALLTEDNCRDLIDGIRSQGQQEFPAIVRPVQDEAYDFEVICGARRHFAVSWLRANNYTQFKYLVEARELSDEEAFRLADIENRDREDISDYERALDYADAVARYYGGKQKAMAERLEVSQPWLSRYLQLAKLPQAIVEAFPNIREIRERNARELKPLLAQPDTARPVLEEAAAIGRDQAQAHTGRSSFVDAATVMRRLTRAGRPPAPKPDSVGKVYRRSVHDKGIEITKRGRKIHIEFEADMSRAQLEGAFSAYLKAEFDA
ncbi:ParB/RepB/Spo0J family partition protein [Tateyamaria sp.]|uniref:ParB/RepB/Spo0J family partition protein n=1 Tax=Tateyamaria sp. TaxID=1929288 RepID=UPI003B2108D7